MKFSIIIPTKDNPLKIRNLLNLLARKLDYSREDYEVIVVDNASRDSNYKLVKRWVERFKRDINIILVREEKEGMSFARNCGIKLAQYNKLIFLDDDILILPDLLNNYEIAWRKHKNASIIGGKVLAILEHGEFSNDQKKKIQKHPWCFNNLDLGQYDRQLKYGELIYSCNMSIKIIGKNKSAGLFDESLGRVVSRNFRICAEDYEICSRYILEGREVWYDPTIETFHITGLNRFSSEYISRRYFLAGLETFLMDQILANNFDNHTSYWQGFVDAVKSSVLNCNLGIFRGYLKSKYDLLMLLNYYLQMKYLGSVKNKVVR